MYVDFKLFEDVADANVSFTLFIKHGKEYVQYFHQTIEYCTVITTIQKQYLFQMVIAGLRHSSNLAFSCPLRKVICYHYFVQFICIKFLYYSNSKNKAYMVNGFTLDTKVIRSYWPSVIFKSVATFTVNRIQVMVVNTFGQLK